ncbi:hypothetical protein [Azotobacter armeniacus]
MYGHDDWVSIEGFAHENEAWLRELLPQANGIPHSFARHPRNVIGRLERKAFAHWMQDSLPSLDAPPIALDGKTLRGSRQNGSAVHLMSAFRGALLQPALRSGLAGTAKSVERPDSARASGVDSPRGRPGNAQSKCRVGRQEAK